jgi:hypothetical protein
MIKHGPAVELMLQNGLQISPVERKCLTMWKTSEEQRKRLEKQLEEKRKQALLKRHRRVYENFVGTLVQDENEALLELAREYPVEYEALERCAKAMNYAVIEFWMFQFQVGGSRMDAFEGIQKHLKDGNDKARKARWAAEQAARAAAPVVVLKFSEDAAGGIAVDSTEEVMGEGAGDSGDVQPATP